MGALCAAQAERAAEPATPSAPGRLNCSSSPIARAEQATLDAELAAEAANRAKSQSFLANLSHEIRTPDERRHWHVRKSLAETQLDPTQREYVDIIRGSAKALLSLINRRAPTSPRSKPIAWSSSMSSSICATCCSRPPRRRHLAAVSGQGH